MSIREIQEIYKLRDDLLRAEGSLTRQIKAIERRLTRIESQRTSSVAQLAAAPLMDARALLHKEKLAIERTLKKKVKSLPQHEFVDKTRGLGSIAFALIVGEAGDLSKYANPAKLWKRMGLAVINGERQRKHTDPAKALEHGYSPRRRAVMHVVGESLIKMGDAYKVVYDNRKVYEKEKRPDDPPIAHHKRSMRYMEKRLLRDLWEFWNGHCFVDT